ncbi:hypothetical protein ABFB09_04025 [Dehalogenimonas sp. THU2]|uniref:hypothetical protein n=1 Tax=Dehalogenimonas sp. THU2 TaxID=3151121 RepID=UPI0032185F15
MKTRMVLLLMAALMTLSVAGCGDAEAITPPQTTAPAQTTAPPLTTQEPQVQWSVNVQVIGKTPVTITHEDAAKIGPVDIVAAIKDGNNVLPAHTFKCILLVDLLEYIGLKTFTVITIESAGVTVEITPDRIDAAAAGFAWMVDGEALNASTGLVKWVNHNRGPKHWADNVTLITVIE